MTSRPELCRAVAERIPGAQIDVLEEEAHQPFQEVPDEWNVRRVDLDVRLSIEFGELL